MPSCTKPKCEFPDTLYIDNSFSDHDRRVIEKSIEEWRYATDGIADVSIGLIDWNEGHRAMIQIINSKHPKIAKKDKDNTSVYGTNMLTLGYADMDTTFGPIKINNGKDIYIVNDRIKNSKGSEKLFHHVALHELGHHFGINHLPQETGALMTPYGDTDCITDLDLREFCDIYDCSGHDIKSTCKSK